MKKHAKKKLFSVLSWNILGGKTLDVFRFKDTQGTSIFKDPVNDDRYYRVSEQAHFIKRRKPDVITLQEVDFNALVIYKEEFAEKYSLASAMPKGLHGGVTIFFDHDVFREVEHLNGGKELKVSDEHTPSGAVCWTVLQHKTYHHKQIVVVNVHISRNTVPGAQGDPLANTKIAYEQWQQLAEVLKKKVLSKLENCSIVMTGDFNTLPEEVESRTLLDVSSLLARDLSIYEHHKATSITPKGNEKQVDYVLHDGLLLQKSKSYVYTSVIDYVKKLHNQQCNKRMKTPLSDHAPIKATFEL